MKYKYEKDNIRFPLPENQKNETFAIIEKVFGGSRMNVNCEDGTSRLARIPRRKRRRIGRIIMGDLLIISTWNIQDEKADILYRYWRNQANFLSRRKMLPKVVDVF
jgi:translation initiation factor 1A